MIRLAVRVRRADAELVLAELLELAPSGVEEVELGDEIVEYAVYGAPGELPELPDLRAAAGSALVELSTTEIADDWAERWREFHRPLVLEGALTVRPPWEPPGETPIDLVIDPGQAFGTGAHATTRLCLELMLELNGGGAVPRPRMRLGRARDRGGEARVRAGAGARQRPGERRRDGGERGAQRRRGRSARHDLRAGELPSARTVAANLLAPLLLRHRRAPADRLGAPGAADRQRAARARGRRDRRRVRGARARRGASAARAGSGPRCCSFAWTASRVESWPGGRWRGGPVRRILVARNPGVREGGEIKLLNPLAIGVTFGGLLLDVVAPRPKPRAGGSPELSLLSAPAVSRTPRSERVAYRGRR